MNTVWIRDYGPNTVYGNGVDDRIIVDWIYNRPRPDDDASPQVIADQMGIDLYETTAEPYDLMNTGGNFMSDGFGTGFASNLIVDENSGGNTWWGTQYPDQSVEEIEGILADFMGLHTYVRMENLPYDGIHHIDMHMKLLDEETILMAEYPEGVADGPQIEANLEYVLANFNSVFGTPYDVVRIPSPPEPGWGGGYPNEGGDYMTYTNSVFVNNTILLPTYYEEYDTTAIAIYEEALPGYNVVGIDCNQIISASGAIHCITHSVGVEDPLLISHQPLDDTEDTVNPYPVEALIQHRSGIAPAACSGASEGETDYNEVAMTAGADDMWSADIPAQAEGTVVQYYVEGTSVSGKTQDRPMPAPEGYWQFRVGEIVVNGLDGNPDFAGFQPAFPNPASAITCVPVELSRAAQGRIALRDAAGREVAVLFDGELPCRRQQAFPRCRAACGRRLCADPRGRRPRTLVPAPHGPLMAIGTNPSLLLGSLAACILGLHAGTVEPCAPMELDCDCPLDTSLLSTMNLPDCWQDLSEFGVALDTAYRFTWQGVDMGHAATFSEGHLTLDLMGTTTYTLGHRHHRLSHPLHGWQPKRQHDRLVLTGERHHLGGQHAIRCHGMGPERLWRSRHDLPHRMKKGGLDDGPPFSCSDPLSPGGRASAARRGTS